MRSGSKPPEPTSAAESTAGADIPANAASFARHLRAANATRRSLGLARKTGLEWALLLLRGPSMSPGVASTTTAARLDERQRWLRKR